jgi:hypothetical protein
VIQRIGGKWVLDWMSKGREISLLLYILHKAFLYKETTTKLGEQWTRTMGTKLFVISKIGGQWGTNI